MITGQHNDNNKLADAIMKEIQYHTEQPVGNNACHFKAAFIETVNASLHLARVRSCTEVSLSFRSPARHFTDVFLQFLI